MDQLTVQLIVRVTARLSVALFAAALIVFAWGPLDWRRVRLGRRLFAAFIGAHTIHFMSVAWLAVVTGGDNIRERDGWSLALTVALLFYVAAFVVVRAWGDVAEGRTSTRSRRVSADVALVAIAVAFLNSYLARAVQMPVYWVPALALVGSVALYFIRTHVTIYSSLMSSPLQRRR